MVSELAHYLGRDPRRTRFDGDIHRLDILRLDGFQGIDVAGEARVGAGSGFGLRQLLLDVPGQVSVTGLPAVLRVVEQQIAQLVGNLVRVTAIEALHVVHIHAATLGEAGHQRVFRTRCRVRRAVWLLGAAGEDGRFDSGRLPAGLAGFLRHIGADALVVAVLQRGNLRPRRVVAEQQLVRLPVDRAVLLHKAVVGVVETNAGLLDSGIAGTL